MSTIHFQQTTTATPEQFLAALTDFGPGRSTLFGNSADEYLRVHEQGLTHADVTEGSGGIWERLHYDWSDPSRIVMPPRSDRPRNIFIADLLLIQAAGGCVMSQPELMLAFAGGITGAASADRRG